MAISINYEEMIKSSLEQEYSEDDVLQMLSTAEFKISRNNVDVTYSNGLTDRFVMVKALVRESDAKKYEIIQ